MTNHQFWLWLFAFVFSMIFALDLLAESEGEFYVEPGLVAKLFDQTESQIKKDGAKSVAVTPMLGFFMGDLTLANRYFKTDYRQLGPLPFLYLHGEKPLLARERFGAVAGVNAGYGYLQHTLKAINIAGRAMNDTATLQWIPFDLGLKVQAVWRSLKPSLDIGFGRLWFHQEGRLDGFDQGFFLSYFYGGAALEMTLAGDFGVLLQGRRLQSLVSGRTRLGLWQIGLGIWLNI